MATHGAISEAKFYDVFLSFRGEDTGDSFTSHLYAALCRKGIITFVDDRWRLRMGEQIAPAILKAIEESRISIIVFSQNYAASRWCLDELVKIHECHKEKNQIVVPVFYKVEPSDVRYQKNSYGQAMAVHETRLGNDSERLGKWRSALFDVSNLNGYHLKKGYDIEIFEDIVRTASIIVSPKDLDINERIVGLEYRLEQLKSDLAIESSNTTLMLGIYGTGGIGKTTLAKVLYDSISNQFEGACFLFNVRETSNQGGQKLLLQTFLSQTLEERNIELASVNEGTKTIKRRLGQKRVLIVLDDVDDTKQLEILAGERDWFGSGSRIIITTRDKHLLDAHQVEKIYEMNVLNDPESLELFCQNAFKRSRPAPNYEDLSNRAIRYANGLPLALKVIGSHLFGKNLGEWKSALDKYEKSPHKDIQSILRISYDSLDCNERDTFLGIACLFKGERLELEDVKTILDAFNFYSEDSIRILVDKSLITVEHSCIRVHDLIQDMGREIVKQEALEEAVVERSRLWFPEYVPKVLTENTEYPMPRISSDRRSKVAKLEKQKLGHTSSSFKTLKMSQARAILMTTTPANFRQRVMQLTGDHTSYLLPFISHCSLFPFGYEFAKQELVTLWVAEGLFQLGTRLEDDREGDEVFDSLVSSEIIVPSRFDQSLDFFHHKTRKLLYKVNQSKITSSALEYVRILQGNMDNIVPDGQVRHLSIDSKSVGRMGFESLKRFLCLRTLFLIPAPGFFVEQVPRDLFLSLKHLRSLNFSRSLISQLPSSIGNLKSLRYIDLSYTPIKHLPDSIITLHKLQTLRLRACLDLLGLPKGISMLTSLRHLDLDIIRQLKSMPPGMGNLTNLQTLSAFLVGKDDGCRIGELKNTINLTGAFCISRIENVLSYEEAEEADLINKNFLSKLELRWTDTRVNDAAKEELILQHLQPPLSLEELTILYYGGFKLPSWISDSSYGHLLDITLYNCRNCVCLPSIGQLASLQFLHIIEMNELQTIDDQFCRDGNGQQGHAFPSLKELTIEVMPALEEWMGVQNGDFPCLNKFKVEHCPKLISLPLLSCLYSLRHLEMSYCANISSLPDGGVATSLEFLIIKDCSELKKNCHKGEGKDWGKIAHVPNIFIDDEEISCQ